MKKTICYGIDCKINIFDSVKNHKPEYLHLYPTKFPSDYYLTKESLNEQIHWLQRGNNIVDSKIIEKEIPTTIELQGEISRTGSHDEDFFTFLKDGEKFSMNLEDYLYFLKNKHIKLTFEILD